MAAEPLHTLWSELGRLPTPEPRVAVSHRFYAALDAYQAGMRTSNGRHWFRNPAWIAVLCAACLLVGYFGRPLISSGNLDSREQLVELREEMRGMRQLVTLSLLQQQSAAERLRGVSWSYRAEPDDVEVLSALLTTINQDANVDVRLAAIDALRKFADSPVAQRGIVQALPRQQSPLVQIELIDVITEFRIQSARPQLQLLAGEADLDENVRKRIEQALGVV
jgi:hypothetical protein